MPEPPTLSVPTRLKLAEVLLARQPGFALTDVSGAWVSMIQLSSRAFQINVFPPRPRPRQRTFAYPSARRTTVNSRYNSVAAPLPAQRAGGHGENRGKFLDEIVGPCSAAT